MNPFLYLQPRKCQLLLNRITTHSSICILQNVNVFLCCHYGCNLHSFFPMFRDSNSTILSGEKKRVSTAPDPARFTHALTPVWKSVLLSMLQNGTFAVWGIFKGEIVCSNVYKKCNKAFLVHRDGVVRNYCSAMGQISDVKRITKVVTLRRLCSLLCLSSGLT
jgi:hypothetical protein